MKDEEDERMNHPPAPKLEAIAAGDEAGSVALHLAACSACERYVANLRSEAAAFRAKTDPLVFADGVRARADASRRGARRAKIAWALGPTLAAAAAVALWLRSPAHPPATLGAFPSAAEHFKGGISIAAIRERGQRQERLTGPFDVQPSDRIRLEIAVDHEGLVTAGLLSSDGAWAQLLAPVSLGAGTHYSELAARFDDTPTDAILLVGPPADVDRARATRNFDAVIAWPVRSEPRR